MIAAYEQSRRHRGVSVNICAKKPVKLSKQQKHIVTLLSKGYKNAEIAEMTGLSIHTVKSHCAAAYAKLDVNSAMDAVLKAKEMGLIKQVV
jgi:LuxR family maltose regulon positive regulatory protein